MKILWTEPSIKDLRNLHAYIARDSEVYANNFIQRLIHAVDKLPDFPRLGRKVPEAEQETVRELIYQNYRIIYRIDKPKVLVHAVLDARRDLRELLAERLLRSK